MNESNSKWRLQSKFYEADIFEFGGSNPGDERGKGSENKP